MIGAAGAALRWAAMAFDPPALVLPWLQLLHAASFGATYLGALSFVARRAPAGQGATAQGYLAIASAWWWRRRWDCRDGFTPNSAALAYAAMVLAAIAGGVCAMLRTGRDEAMQ